MAARTHVKHTRWRHENRAAQAEGQAMPMQFMRALHLGHIQRPGGGGTSGGGGGPDMALGGSRARETAGRKPDRIGGFVQKLARSAGCCAEDGGPWGGAL